jgi:uncharacterized membrane protein YgaE (UPF0421/DUF939 family)
MTVRKNGRRSIHVERMAGCGACGADRGGSCRIGFSSAGYSACRNRTGLRLLPLVITQSSLGAAVSVSWQRFVGAALGGVVGTILASHFGANVRVFAIAVFLVGLLCAAVRADRNTFRFGGITLAIVLFVPRAGPAWRLAFDQFAGVSIGIGVALVLAVVWPEQDEKLLAGS